MPDAIHADAMPPWNWPGAYALSWMCATPTSGSPDCDVTTYPCPMPSTMTIGDFDVNNIAVVSFDFPGGACSGVQFDLTRLPSDNSLDDLDPVCLAGNCDMQLSGPLVFLPYFDQKTGEPGELDQQFLRLYGVDTSWAWNVTSVIKL